MRKKKKFRSKGTETLLSTRSIIIVIIERKNGTVYRATLAYSRLLVCNQSVGKSRAESLTSGGSRRLCELCKWFVTCAVTCATGIVALIRTKRGTNRRNESINTVKPVIKISISSKGNKRVCRSNGNWQNHRLDTIIGGFLKCNFYSSIWLYWGMI